jgi:hypothetical protein
MVVQQLMVQNGLRYRLYQCGFKGSSQHFSYLKNWSGANEATSSDILFGGPAG